MVELEGRRNLAHLSALKVSLGSIYVEIRQQTSPRPAKRRQTASPGSGFPASRPAFRAARFGAETGSRFDLCRGRDSKRAEAR